VEARGREEAEHTKAEAERKAKEEAEHQAHEQAEKVSRLVLLDNLTRRSRGAGD